MTLVSCIYGCRDSSIYGGRGWDLAVYQTTLINILKLERPLVLFTDPGEVERTEKFISSYAKNDFKVIGQPLSCFEYHDLFLEYKKEIYDSIVAKNRNEILCYSKPYWVKQVLDEGIFDTKTAFWIDAGLFHHGIFPEKIGGIELRIPIDNNWYHPHNPNNVFTPKLANKIYDNLNLSKMFFCALPMQGMVENQELIVKEHYNLEVKPHLKWHLVGGFFGGYKDIYNIFFERYREMLKLYINKKLYVTEEPIFSSLYTVFPEMFDLKFFDLWWFYSPGERTSYLSEEANSFYKIFTNYLTDV